MGIELPIDNTDPELLSKKGGVVEPGIYEFKVAGKGGGQFKTEPAKGGSGNSVIAVELTVINHESENGKKCYDNLVVVDSAKWKIAQFSRSCGLQSVPGPDGKPRLKISEAFGKTCKARVKQSTYQKGDGSEGLRNEIVEYLFDMPAGQAQGSGQMVPVPTE